ncbi:MAG: phage terminase large subunit family protein [Gammaproteobacteria bacterium]|nr:phage terminase large subunit family protein [Gammaproteobacteria bacterium]
MAERFLDECFFSALEPPKHDLTINQWADENRILSSKSSAEPGKFKTSRTPYAKEPMEFLSTSSSVRKVVLMWGSQLGKTEIGNNFIGYVIDYAPASMLVVQPNVGLARRQSKMRIAPMIEACPSLLEKIPPARRRDSDNTALEKGFPGGILLFAGAEAASGLASMPIKNLFLDEIDRFPHDVEKEGDPVDLAEARTKTYGRNKKILITSTPTLKGESRIENEYELSDQRSFEVPCPHCDGFQVLKFGHEGAKFGLTWENNDPKTATYMCEHCGVYIKEEYKTQMLENGVWVPKYPEREVKGYHLNSLYCPVGFYSWADMVTKFLNCKGKPAKLKTFVNTDLAETWEEKGDSPDHEKIYRRRETYKTGVVPKDAFLLTAGVDIQKDRIEIMVQGWGKNLHRYAVDYIVLQGDTTDQDVWNQLERALYKDYEHALGGTINISKMAVDTGYNTQICYNWVRQQNLNLVMGIKGGPDSMPQMLGRPTKVDVTIEGDTVYYGLQIWVCGVGHAKLDLFGYLNKDAPLEKDDPFPFGWCHYPEWDLNFFQGLCSEKRVYSNGKYKWIVTYERNEPLDTSVYARLASAAIGIDSWGDADWDVLREQIIMNAKDIKPRPAENSQASWIKRDRDSYI